MLKSLFLTTVTHFQPLASGPVALVGVGGWLLQPPGLVLATVTHFEPFASGLAGFVGSWSLPQSDPTVMPR